MKKVTLAGMFSLGAAFGVGGHAATSKTLDGGTVYVRFAQQLPDGGVRDLGRTGCYELGGDVKASIEPCTRSR